MAAHDHNGPRGPTVLIPEPTSLTPLEKLMEMPAVEVSDVCVSFWDEILSMRNEKDAIEKQIALPLANPNIAGKHGVTVPKVILLFGPPGTGKTAFAKGISARLVWKFMEISPSALGVRDQKEAYELKIIFDSLKQIDRAVVFFDEFEELAMRPDAITKEERVISNEFLKQLPKLRGVERILVVCATNNIRMLNPAVLRPGRFDLIFPVGSLDLRSRRNIFEYKTQHLMVDSVDFDLIAEKAERFTPADIEAIVAVVSQHAFEKEIEIGKEWRSRTEDFLLSIDSHRPTISTEEMEEFLEDARRYCRADYCSLF